MRLAAICSITTICCMVASGAVADAQTSASPKAAPPAAVAIDGAGYFHIGEMFEALTWATFYPATGDRLAERFDKLAADCRRLGAPQKVLDDIDAVKKAKLSLDFLKKPLATWTDVERKLFRESRSLDDALWIKWLNEPGFEPRFFWHVGRDSFQVWFSVARDVEERGVKLTAYETELRKLASSANIYLTDSGYAKARGSLAPEALAALKAIAEQSQLMDDPFGEGVTRKNFDTITKNCRVLRDLARENKLTVSPVKP
jgi:hypothetical protein